MSIKKKIVQIRDAYVINQAQRAKLPKFKTGNVRRYRVTFSGRVQNVGFRLEVCELAKRLGLTGFCKNLQNGDVLAELQGPESKIQYLISFMESLVRIKIKNKVMEELEILSAEKEFQQR